MKPSTRRSALCISFIGVWLFGAGSVLGQTTSPTSPAEQQALSPAPVSLPLDQELHDEAREEYLRGMMLVQIRDYAGARLKFRRAYALQPAPRLLREIAVCEKDLKHYSRALTLLQEYREKAKDTIAADEDKYLRDLERTFRGFTSEMTLLVSEADATIWVDGEIVGTSPLSKPIRVDLGERRVTVQKSSFKTFDVKRTVEGGTPIRLVADLQREWTRGRLIVTSGAKNLIAIDGKPMALGRFEGYLKPGGHNVRVSAPGMVSSSTEISLRENEVRTFTVDLVPVQPPLDPSKWLWIGGGVALLTGAIIGGAASYEAPDKPLVNGTIANQNVGSSQ